MHTELRVWSSLEYILDGLQSSTENRNRSIEYTAHQLCDHQAAAGNEVVEDAVRRLVVSAFCKSSPRSVA
jgi:hypothetical protein